MYYCKLYLSGQIDSSILNLLAFVIVLIWEPDQDSVGWYETLQLQQLVLISIISSVARAIELVGPQFAHVQF